jgi:hypothetical protein
MQKIKDRLCEGGTQFDGPHWRILLGDAHLRISDGLRVLWIAYQHIPK